MLYHGTGVELGEAYQLGTDAADPERKEPEREGDMKEHQESLEDAGMNKKQRTDRRGERWWG